MTEAYGYQPTRVALCTCGWASRRGTLSEVNTFASIHVSDGCEGCDHATRVEYVGKEARQ